MKEIDGELLSEEDIVTRYSNMVYKIAHRYKRHARVLGIEFEDIVQEGFIGLIKSYRKFEPDRKNKFITYSFDIVKYAILHYMRDFGLVRMSRYYRVIFLKMYKEGLTHEEPEVVAKKLDVPIEDVEKAFFYNSTKFVSSLDQSSTAKISKDSDPMDRDAILNIFGGYDDHSSVYTEMLKDDLNKRLSFVLEERLKEKSQAEIAQMLDVSQVSVFRYVKEIRQIYLENHA